MLWKLKRWWRRTRLHQYLECRAKRCDYYTHYCAYGPPELNHEGYHAACDQARIYQKRLNDWYEQHKNDDAKEPAGLVKICEEWERRVRA